MKIETTKPFDRDFLRLSAVIRRNAERKFQLLLKNLRHPSLRVKKMEDPRNIWEGRITKQYRFTFQVVGDVYFFRRIGTHDILRKP